MRTRHIYVDIDDVLSATIERLVELLDDLHERRVEPSEVAYFDLSRSFGLDREEIDSFMQRAHDDDVLLSIRPVAGAADVLAAWNALGHRVSLVTGRPPRTNAASRRWLETHDFNHESLHHLDKWKQPSWNLAGLPVIEFDDLADLSFEFAVEDNLDTALRLIEEFDIPVALMDRPWNRETSSLSKKARASMVRCHDWGEIADLFDGS